MKTILFIDGRNFIHKINLILDPYKKKDIDFSIYNFKGLIDKVLLGINLDRKIFYFGRLIKHPETLEKSERLIEKQRKLKANLEGQGFEVILAGRVRGHIEKCVKGHETLTFREKGVDVRIAVDMITLACDEGLRTAIIGSSDSDLQPAIRELKERKVERIYLGFEDSPNMRNIKDLEQEEAAKKMNTSQSTFQRILSSAYRKITEALINGKAIRIIKR